VIRGIEEKFGGIRGCGDPEQPAQTAKKQPTGDRSTHGRMVSRKANEDTPIFKLGQRLRNRTLPGGENVGYILHLSIDCTLKLEYKIPSLAH
jgi:hypothetical protein